MRPLRFCPDIHAPHAAALAQSFSPWIEVVDDSTAVFSITTRQLAGIPPALQIAVAATVETAILAARNLPGFTFLPPGEEARILGTLPLDCLPPDPEIFRTLDLWGVHSLADLVRLPEDGLIGRLGPRGLWLQKLARGTLAAASTAGPLRKPCLRRIGRTRISARTCVIRSCS